MLSRKVQKVTLVYIPLVLGAINLINCALFPSLYLLLLGLAMIALALINKDLLNDNK